MSSNSSSPYRSSDRNIDLFESVMEKEREALNEAVFAADIGSKMRVPKRITLTGAEDDIFSLTAPMGFNKAASFASAEDPVLRNMMTVPDRILVAGQERHIGAKAPPRELQLERAVLPPEAEAVRVQTPPRVLTLEEYKFPSADDPPSVAPAGSDSDVYSCSAVSTRDSSLTVNGNLSSHSKMDLEASFSVNPMNATLVASGDEVQVLRQQISRLNRRVMHLEAESVQRQQRDVFLGILAVAYAVIKTINWLRN